MKKDPTNNYIPQKIIYDLTGLKRNKDIFNFQVSHILGRTKNPFAFSAPWNIVYIPKILDPFTGHESKGELTQKITRKLREMLYHKYEEMIEEFNGIMTDDKMIKNRYRYIENLKTDNTINQKKVEQFEKDLENQLSPIIIK